MKRYLPLLLLIAAAHAQTTTWFTVATEGDTVIFNSPPVTVQFGVPAGTPVTVAGSVPCTKVGGCWDKPLVLSSGPPVTLAVNLAAFAGADPAVGTVKLLQVAETASEQTLTVNGIQKTVPALAVPVVTPPTSPLTFAWTLTLDATGKPIGATCTPPLVSK